MERRFGAIILGRLDSQRLPGKVLADVHGRPLLWYLLERLRQVQALNLLVMATSDRPVDDPIADYCAGQGLAVYRGSVDDVAGRVLGCVQTHGLTHFLRVNADSPFLEPGLVAQGWAAVLRDNWDFVTNLRPRSFPYGVSLELLRSDVYAAAYPQIQNPAQREHITGYFYEHLDNYRWHNIRRSPDLSEVRLTVDTPQDLALFRRVLTIVLPRWHSLEYTDVVQLYRKAAEPDD